MVSILPSARSSWDVIGDQIGANLNQNLPGTIERAQNRQLGLNALSQAEQDIGQANGDPYKIALAFAKVGAVNPNLERSLGPLAQTAMANAKVNRAFPEAPGARGMPGMAPQSQGMPQAAPSSTVGAPQPQPSTFATPSAFNVMTKDDMDAEAKRYAISVQDPSAYQSRFNSLQTQNDAATAQRAALEDMALKSDVSPSDLPRFMIVGSKFDPRNPSEWMQNAKREFAKVKSADTKLERAFIPGLGNGLLGTNREEHLKNLENPVKDLVNQGLEQETRQHLADNFLTPTEVETLIHPLTPKIQNDIKKLPRGFFPLQTGEKGRNRPLGEKPEFVSYEEAREKDPQSLQRMQDQLANFFINNVNDNTSLLPMRQKIIEDRDYDWQQIGPAIRQAEKMGLKLNQQQLTEMADIESQAPYQSLPEIFQSLDRVIKYFRGNK